MSRHPLPQTQQEAQGSAFFPTFQKEMNRFLDQFRSGFPALDVIETDDIVETSAEVQKINITKT